jgi:hypothetical protein
MMSLTRSLKFAVILAFAVVLVACGGGDDLKKAPLPPGFNNSADAGTTDTGGVDASTNNGSNNGSTDAGTPDGGSNNATTPGCSDGLLNLDETDVDCGGSMCDACSIGESCRFDNDCTSGLCDANVCADQPLVTGAPCTLDDECASGLCKDFDGESICTESCETTCPGQNLACFRSECVPDDYCDDPDGDGFGFGPGCLGQPCDRCSNDATCAEQADGSFTCMCNTGYSGDGVSCIDVDECAGANPCDPNARCTNTPGSFTCACQQGFSGDGFSCSDIDECSIGADNCDPNATCSNLAGTFSCSCDAGYTGSGTSCSDVNECALGQDNCSVNATCSNTPGGFDCACDAGYSGDGVTCVLGARAPNSGEIVINEIMQNPDAQFDSEGEWFEIYNASGATLDLDGCRVLSGSSTGDDEFTIAGLPEMAPGDYFVFARSPLFGGTSDYVYNGAINLNNSTDDLEIRCVTSSGFEQQIDFVAWDDGITFPDPMGASMNLDLFSRDTLSNDFGSNWCLGNSPYYLTDQGTPGLPNRACP